MHRLCYLIFCSLVAACSADSAPLVASNVEITATWPGTRTSAGYLTLTNTTDRQITITSVSSPEFESVEMHESVVEDGVSRMIALEELAILPDQTVVFEPGAKHLMLMQPRGDVHAVTLQFFAGEAPVLSVTAHVMQ